MRRFFPSLCQSSPPTPSGLALPLERYMSNSSGRKGANKDDARVGDSVSMAMEQSPSEEKGAGRER